MNEWAWAVINNSLSSSTFDRHPKTCRALVASWVKGAGWAIMGQQQLFIVQLFFFERKKLILLDWPVTAANQTEIDPCLWLLLLQFNARGWFWRQRVELHLTLAAAAADPLNLITATHLKTIWTAPEVPTIRHKPTMVSAAMCTKEELHHLWHSLILLSNRKKMNSDEPECGLISYRVVCMYVVY